MPLTDSLEERVAYFDYGEVDRALLAELAPTFEKHADSLVAAFYRHLLSYPAMRHLLRDPAVKERLLRLQREYLASLAGPALDAAYVAQRRVIGEVHERIGLEPGWYLGAYALYLSLLTPLVCERFATEPHRGERALMALQKLLLFDASLAMETYIGRRERELQYLNQELSRSGRELAHDLEAQGAKLRQTAERAQAAEQLASIGTLVAGLAHEIGTPMGVIQGHAKLLESKLSDEQARWRLQTIQEQIARISKIIQSLLNMARPTRLARGPVALAALLDDTLAFLGEKLRRRDIHVARSFGAVPSVRGDAERLQQLFLNLFMNAADAMQDGGELRVALRPLPGEVEIEVGDTGAGIAAPDLARIFDPFFTTKPAGEGNGLGLSVARNIVTDHGGQIEVQSAAGEGTTFRIRLPIPSKSRPGSRARPGA
jgi:signal transduction histidine kinase